VKFTRADFIPLARFVADPCVLIVNDQQPYKTLKELTDDAKKRPDEIICSSPGLYGALHIPMALCMKAAGGLKFRHLPINGGGPVGKTASTR
jgi:tripartite-type tricarboxylate transporter receptor subunit TctC